MATDRVSGHHFPARRLGGRQQGATGEWIQVYREEQDRRFQATLAPTRTSDASSGQLSNSYVAGTRRPPNSPFVGTDMQYVLDGYCLLHHGHVIDPIDLCSVDLSGQELEQVVDEDLQLFTNLMCIKAGDNRFSFDAFVQLPSLLDLSLQANCILRLTVESGMYSSLKELDLSSNSLELECLEELGCLPSLVKLDVSGNGFIHLPPAMVQHQMEVHGSGKRIGKVIVKKPRFAKLQELRLSNNELEDPFSIAVLASLQRLERVYLDGNRFRAIPVLKLRDPYATFDSPRQGPRLSSIDTYARESTGLSSSLFSPDDALPETLYRPAEPDEEVDMLERLTSSKPDAGSVAVVSDSLVAGGNYNEPSATPGKDASDHGAHAGESSRRMPVPHGSSEAVPVDQPVHRTHAAGDAVSSHTSQDNSPPLVEEGITTADRSQSSNSTKRVTVTTTGEKEHLKTGAGVVVVSGSAPGNTSGCQIDANVRSSQSPSADATLEQVADTISIIDQPAGAMQTAPLEDVNTDATEPPKLPLNEPEMLHDGSTNSAPALEDASPALEDTSLEDTSPETPPQTNESHEGQGKIVGNNSKDTLKDGQSSTSHALTASDERDTTPAVPRVSISEVDTMSAGGSPSLLSHPGTTRSDTATMDTATMTITSAMSDDVGHAALAVAAPVRILPFPCLEFLDFSRNKVSFQELLLPAAQMSSLKHINVAGNPFVRKSRAASGLLFNVLSTGCGIIIQRNPEGVSTRTVPGSQQMAVKMSLDNFIEVDGRDRLPAIPRQPVEERISSERAMMLEYHQSPPLPLLEETESPSISPSQSIIPQLPSRPHTYPGQNWKQKKQATDSQSPELPIQFQRGKTGTAADELPRRPNTTAPTKNMFANEEPQRDIKSCMTAATTDTMFPGKSISRAHPAMRRHYLSVTERDAKDMSNVFLTQVVEDDNSLGMYSADNYTLTEEARTPGRVSLGSMAEEVAARDPGTMAVIPWDTASDIQHRRTNVSEPLQRRPMKKSPRKTVNHREHTRPRSSQPRQKPPMSISEDAYELLANAEDDPNLVIPTMQGSCARMLKSLLDRSMPAERIIHANKLAQPKHANKLGLPEQRQVAQQPGEIMTGILDSIRDRPTVSEKPLAAAVKEGGTMSKEGQRLFKRIEKQFQRIREESEQMVADMSKQRDDEMHQRTGRKHPKNPGLPQSSHRPHPGMSQSSH
eukprot:scpid24384/ scgid2814/ X-ray radiation resistance-associated protein 1